MPYSIHIDPKVNCVLFRFYGSFTVGSRLEGIEQMLSQIDYKNGMKILTDSREQPFPSSITFKKISEAVKKMEVTINKIQAGCQWATVVSDAQHYATMHRYIALTKNSGSMVERKPFRDIDKAREWLGIPADYQIKYPEDSNNPVQVR